MATLNKDANKAPKTVKLSQTSKNADLEKAFAKIIENGQPIVFAITDTVNDDYKMLWICQKKELEFQKVTEVQKTFLGWSDRDARIVRTGQAISTAILDDMGLSAGDVLEDYDIKVVRLSFPAYDDQEPVRKVDSDGNVGEPILVSGKPVYEHRELVAL